MKTLGVEPQSFAYTVETEIFFDTLQEILFISLSDEQVEYHLSVNNNVFATKEKHRLVRI